MKGARVVDWAKAPEFIDVPDLPAPSDGQLQLKILAAAVTHVVRLRASQKHPPNAELPWDPSVDGIGLDEATGERYVIGSLAASVFSERANVDKSRLVDIPPEVDAVHLAAMANAGAASWMALRRRVVGGCRNKTVCILGATGAAGRMAPFIARHLGASRIVGAGRAEDSLKTVEGLDDYVLLKEDFEMPSHIGPIDICIDFVGGPIAAEFLKAVEIRPGENLQYVLNGGLAGYDNLVIPNQVILQKPIRIMASSVGSWGPGALAAETPGLIEVLCRIELPFKIFEAPLSEVHEAWTSEENKSKRLVLIP